VGGRALLLAAACGALHAGVQVGQGQKRSGFRTKPQLAAELVVAAQEAKIGFRAVVADCFYGDNTGLVEALGRAGVAFVLALKPRKGVWAPDDAAHTPVEAARELGWGGPGRPGAWRRIQRRFRDGHTETWWAADAVLGGWGPDRHHRLVVATTDPERLPRLSTWYLLTNLARPASRRAQQTQLGEIVAAYGLRNWVEQATSRSRTSSAGPTSRSEATGRSGGTGRWRAWRSAFAGTPARPKRWRQAPGPCYQRPQRRRPRRPRGGPSNVSIRAAATVRVAGVVVSWPQARRRVRGWLAPLVWLQRCWRGWSTSPPPRQLQQALDWVMAGRPTYLHLPP
jgi:hypothetical protein